MSSDTRLAVSDLAAAHYAAAAASDSIRSVWLVAKHTDLQLIEAHIGK